MDIYLTTCFLLLETRAYDSIREDMLHPTSNCIDSVLEHSYLKMVMTDNSQVERCFERKASPSICLFVKKYFCECI